MFTLSTPVLAADHAKESLVTTEQILTNLETSNFSREVTFVPLDTSTTFTDRELLKFDSVEEAENFLQQFITCLDDSQSAESATPSFAANNTHNDSVTWWAPSLGDVFAWKNIAYTYTLSTKSTGTKYVSDITVNDSWINHLAIALSWTHKYGNAENIKTTQKPSSILCTSDLSATGVWLVGFEISGFPIGAQVNDTWEHSISFEIDK